MKAGRPGYRRSSLVFLRLTRQIRNESVVSIFHDVCPKVTPPRRTIQTARNYAPEMVANRKRRWMMPNPWPTQVVDCEKV
ncbi:hypothetical protein TNIN_247381 [Trichonephila inaurata madagascariensis]|uniref:Uncharacterized protein n=1 Tax=Trichonephila inaurata madagascariensis TaxID=2747483 RepID=A0A8X6WYJ0_9ARAC|nr:hypothetical protein TNIN_247381 [Trichonephila inaurata madagascariensis]